MELISEQKIKEFIITENGKTQHAPSDSIRELPQSFITAAFMDGINKGINFAISEIEKQIQKRYYWLKPDGTISNMWNEEDHKRYLTDEEIEKARDDGWHLIQINLI